MKEVKIKREIVLDEKQFNLIKSFLAGKYSSREVAVFLGMSHQGVINLVHSLARQWYQQGKINI